MSKTFARSSLCALTMTIMNAHAAEPPTNLDKPEGRLDIIAWPGYIERGQTDKQYDWVTQFEKETGCAVNGFAPIFPDTCYHLTHYWL
ncbi:hypothetical protein FSH89_014560, partial [Escherichia coli]|nr:hypothetical protein [Escherichia coli]